MIEITFLDVFKLMGILILSFAIIGTIIYLIRNGIEYYKIRGNKNGT